jgi:thioredoxin 1
MEVTTKGLEALLKHHSSTLILIEFWGSWCPPCQTAKIVMDMLEKKYADQIKIAKVNVDRNPSVASKYAIMGVPTYIIFQNGLIVSREVGAKSQTQLEEMIKKVL